ncbi:MAG: SRPBCC family protein [Burkholderiales bacterium]|nr:SRPBCC family protein [Burkholderiales bacterium]
MTIHLHLHRHLARRAALALPCLAAAGLLGLALLTPAEAHGPTRQKVSETITIDAAPDVVWARVKNFAALHDWHPALAGSTTTDGNNVGSVRTLQLKGGGTIVESLETYAEADKRYAYRMKDPGPVPVTNYSSTLQVKPGSAAGTTLVEWRGAFYRGYPNNDPPPDKNDEAAIAAITGIYKAGLGNLKSLVEKK